MDVIKLELGNKRSYQRFGTLKGTSYRNLVGGIYLQNNQSGGL